MIRRILVGIDGTDDSLRALRWATERAADLDAEILAVCAVPPAAEFVLTLPPLSTDLSTSFQTSLERDWSQPLRDAGVEYRLFVADEEPAHALVNVARRERADLLVLGARGHSSLSERLFGSLSSKVAHQAPCPVVMVPPGPCPARSDAA